MKTAFMVLAMCLALVTPGDVFAQQWEPLGPGFGYLPEAFFVSKNAIYLGLCEDDLETGLGLYRYRFDTQQWDLFAWAGSRIFGVTVWGESDENILVLRCACVTSGYTDVMRSADGGGTWTLAKHFSYTVMGLTQAPSDTSHVLIQFPTLCSMDAGWSWTVARGAVPPNGSYDACFDPSNADVAYLTGQNAFGWPTVCQSTDGGAHWSTTYEIYGAFGIDVERSNTTHVMGGTVAFAVIVSTNAGGDWSVPVAPLITVTVL